MSWEAATLLVTVVCGVLPLVATRRRRHRTKPAEQSWTLSVRVGRHRR
jgi:hypothetical protein